MERLADAERPSESEEIWRYSIIDSLDFDALVPADTYRTYESESSNNTDRLEQAKTSLGLSPYIDYCNRIASQVVGNSAAVIVVYGGVCIAVRHDKNVGGISITSLPKEAPKGIESFDNLDEQDGQSQQDVFRLMNSAYGPGPIALDIDKDTTMDSPIVVVNMPSSDQQRNGAQEDMAGNVQRGDIGQEDPEGEVSTSFSALSITIGKRSAASIIEVVVQAPDDDMARKLFVPVTMMNLEDNATLSYANIQLLSDSYWQVGHLESIVERNAELKSLGVSIGGSYARTLTTSTLAGEGGSSELMSAYIATDNQTKDMRTIQTHSARHTVSNLLFAGIAGGHSSTVYSGLIEIKPGAKGSNAIQTNRNLILSEQAKADSVPNLTIEENDVHCNHASSTGPIDPEQVYYLESRGIDTDTARWLIASGFFSDIYDKNPVADSTKFISSAIDQRLKGLEKG